MEKERIRDKCLHAILLLRIEYISHMDTSQAAELNQVDTTQNKSRKKIVFFLFKFGFILYVKHIFDV